MEQINQMNETIENTTNSEEKIKLINELGKFIENENITLNKTIDSINNTKDLSIYIIPSKYKTLSQEQLEEIFNKCTDINEKINIYYSMFVKINNIKLEIFS